VSSRDVEAPSASPDQPSDSIPNSVKEEAVSEEVAHSPEVTEESAAEKGAPEAEAADTAAADPSSTPEGNAEPIKESEAAAAAGESEAEKSATEKGAPEAEAADTAAADPSSTPESVAEAIKEAGSTAPEKGEAEKSATEKGAPEAEAADTAAADPSSTPEGNAESIKESEAAAAAGESEAVRALRRAMQDKSEIEGRVIGWNNGGFHVVVGTTTAFCPRSEMELGAAKEPGDYVDETLKFQVLRVQKKGRRVVLSRAALLRGERSRVRSEARGKLTAGSVVTGRVASLTDFGAFIDLGGVQGLVHVSEMSRHRIEHPSDLLKPGQEVEVKILKLEKGGRRISLSMRALEPDPWQGIQERFPEGGIVTGKVEKTTNFGAFIELEPGLTGLLPAAAISLPRDASLARVYPPGKQVKVQVVSVDSRRQRISLTLEGSTLEGSRRDYQAYLRDQHQTEPATGFNALADAFRKIDTDKK